MAEKKTTLTTTTTKPFTGMFDRQNLVLMGVGAVLIALGMLLMAGGKSPDPAVFNEKEVYSITRITIAPILIILGLFTEVVAIFRKPRVVL